MDITNNTCYQFNECSVDGMCHKNANCHGFKCRIPKKIEEIEKSKIQVAIKVGYNPLDLKVSDLYSNFSQSGWSISYMI